MYLAFSTQLVSSAMDIAPPPELWDMIYQGKKLRWFCLIYHSIVGTSNDRIREWLVLLPFRYSWHKRKGYMLTYFIYWLSLWNLRYLVCKFRWWVVERVADLKSVRWAKTEKVKISLNTNEYEWIWMNINVIKMNEYQIKYNNKSYRSISIQNQ